MHPGLLLVGDLGDAAWGLINVLIGLGGLAAAIVGWLFRPLPPLARAYFGVVGVLSILPGVYMSVVTFLAFVLASGWLRITSRRTVHGKAGPA
jgi:TRAP-type uncharacterized transport system fused permease subunit